MVTNPTLSKKNTIPDQPASQRVNRENLPRHLAIIMDGNGRWAKERNLSRIQGHRAGAESVRVIVRSCRKIGIPVLTLYAFSKENWQRPSREVQALWQLLSRYLKSELFGKVNNISDLSLPFVRFINDLSSIPYKFTQYTFFLNNISVILNVS